jgi:hypothetical protein
MINKYLRLGYTESDLLFIYYLVNYSSKKIDIHKDEYLKESAEVMLKWFYSTSGFYDKSISEINIKCFFSKNFESYMRKIINIVKNSTKCLLLIHDFFKDYYMFFGEFAEYLESKVFCEIWFEDKSKFNLEFDTYCNINKFMENKNILLINPLSELMYQQYKSNNVYNANNVNFPQVKNILYYKNIYTFFNNGPGASVIDTYSFICKEVSAIKEDYDCVVISSGAYSCLIADFISTKIGKDVFVIGGTLNNLFALKTQRLSEHTPNFICNEFWIDIPNELKPVDYRKIENGCYW